MAEIHYSEEIVRGLKGKVVVMTGMSPYTQVNCCFNDFAVQEGPRASAAQR